MAGRDRADPEDVRGDGRSPRCNDRLHRRRRRATDRAGPAHLGSPRRRRQTALPVHGDLHARPAQRWAQDRSSHLGERAAEIHGSDARARLARQLQLELSGTIAAEVLVMLPRDVCSARARIATRATQDREDALELSRGTAADDRPLLQLERVKLEPFAVRRVRPATDREASGVKLADGLARRLIEQLAAHTDALAFHWELAQPAVDRAPVAPTEDEGAWLGRRHDLGTAGARRADPSHTGEGHQGSRYRGPSRCHFVVLLRDSGGYGPIGGSVAAASGEG